MRHLDGWLGTVSISLHLVRPKVRLFPCLSAPLGVDVMSATTMAPHYLTLLISSPSQMPVSVLGPGIFWADFPVLDVGANLCVHDAGHQTQPPGNRPGRQSLGEVRAPGPMRCMRASAVGADKNRSSGWDSPTFLSISSSVPGTSSPRARSPTHQPSPRGRGLSDYHRSVRGLEAGWAWLSDQGDRAAVPSSSNTSAARRAESCVD
jgi:hypothetical protein